MASEMNKECLWYCFSGMLQADCNAVKEHWNAHYIRQSRHDTVKGRPDSLLFLPEYHSVMNNLLSSVESSEIECVSQQIIVKQDFDEYQEYLTMFVKVSILKPPLPGKKLFSNTKS